MENLVAWATDAFQSLNLIWKDAPTKAPNQRVLGHTADKAALMDLTIRHGKVFTASAVVPVKPEYTPMLTLLLAALVEGGTLTEADAFLARTLNRLKRDRPSAVTTVWHRWRVIVTTNQLGLLTLQVK